VVKKEEEKAEAEHRKHAADRVREQAILEASFISALEPLLVWWVAESLAWVHAGKKGVAAEEGFPVCGGGIGKRVGPRRV